MTQRVCPRGVTHAQAPKATGAAVDLGGRDPLPVEVAPEIANSTEKLISFFNTTG